MTNSTTAVKSHENSQKNASHEESVGNILNNVENVPFALRGSTVKTIIYFLFSFIAAAELTAALSFYTMSMGLSLALAAVFCGLIAFGFHALLHGILSDTAKGIVFSKRKESGAMSNEVNVNIVLSIFLLAIASCTVFFVGKKGFTAYRATQYEKVQAEATPKGDQPKGIDANMLTSKSGKISAWKLEALTDLKKAEAKSTEATTVKDEAERSRYDATTAQITDIVGASAFLIELLLALLAYSIATAKLAAVMDEIARRNGATSQQATTGATAQSTPSVQSPIQPQAASSTASPTPPTQQETAKTGITQRFNEYSDNDQSRIIESSKKNLEKQGYYFSIEQIKAYLSRVNGLITVVNIGIDTVEIKMHQPINVDEITTTTASVTASVTPQKQIGFSDNKANKTGNDGRTVIKGFQRQNSEKAPITASVTASVTDAVIEKEDSKLKMCLYCEEEYIYRIHNQKYCSEDCRIAAWNEKTGKKLRKGVKA